MIVSFILFLLAFHSSLVASQETTDDCINPDDPRNAGIYQCIDVDLRQPREDRKPPPYYSGFLADSDKILFKLDLASYNRTAFPQGLSLFVIFLPHNAYDPEPVSDMVLLSNENTRYKPKSDGRYTHSGKYDLQTAPHELEPTTYYVELRNLLDRDPGVDYTIEFHFDAPRLQYVDSEFHVLGDGDKLLYYYFNVTPPNRLPKFVSSRIDSSIGELADACAAERDFVKQRGCETTLLMTAVQQYWGTRFAMCLATEELRRGVARDCWLAAVTVGRQAASRAFTNLFEAFAMCPDDLCDDGCRHGVVEAWVRRHYDDDSFLEEAQGICLLLDDETESCYEGLGAGLFTVLSNNYVQTGQQRIEALPEVLKACERVTDAVEELLQVASIRWCLDGAFRHYMAAAASTLNDTAYREAFPHFCDPAQLGTDARLLARCHDAQAFSAAIRTRGDRSEASALCGQLFAAAELQESTVGGKYECQRALGVYLGQERLAKETNAVCSHENLYSYVLYNLDETYSSAKPPVPPVEMQTLSWFGNGTESVWGGVQPKSGGNGLWWLAVDANECREPIKVRVWSTNPWAPPVPKNVEPAPVNVGDLERKHVVDEEAIQCVLPRPHSLSPQQTRTRRKKIDSDITTLYGGVTAGFVVLKLLLLLWLRKKLAGYELVGRK